MKNWEVIVGAVALVAGLWAQVKSMFYWAKGFVIETHWVDSDVAETLTAYFVHLQVKRTVREKSYGMSRFFVRPLSQSHLVAYEDLTSSGGVVWYKNRPVWFTQVESARHKDYDSHMNYRFSFIRRTVAIETLLLDAAAWASTTSFNTGSTIVRHKVHYHHGRTLGSEIARERNESGASPARLKVSWDATKGKRLLKWNPRDIGGNQNGGTFDSLALTPDLQRVVDRVKLWKKSERWYRDRGIAWRLGFMFEGPPGTGKTSMVRAAGEELDMPVHIFDLATMSNEDLRNEWSEMAADAPCIALIEDVDAVFNGRDNVTKTGGVMSSGGLTFDALLNCIDGIERHDGVLLVVTTNHADKVDPALAKRGGRVDQIVNFKPLTFDQRLRVAENIVGNGSEAFKLAAEAGDMVAGTFVEHCCRKALTDLYAETNRDPYR